MVSRKVTVINPGGLHLSPAGNLCKEALKYRSKIQLVCRDTEANAKSVLSVLGACVKYGEEVEYRCSGPDEEAALEAVVELTELAFGEDE